MCQHQPPCPPADATDHAAARAVARHPEQGWSLLCNGVLVFEDTGELLPGGRIVPPNRRAGRPSPVTGLDAGWPAPAPARPPTAPVLAGTHAA
jgi:hypothetical protein